MPPKKRKPGNNPGAKPKTGPGKQTRVGAKTATATADAEGEVLVHVGVVPVAGLVHPAAEQTPEPELEPDSELEPESEPDLEEAGEQAGGDPHAGQRTSRRERQVTKRRVENAAKVGMEPQDPRFAASLESKASFDFLQALPEEWRVLVTVDDIRAAVPIPTEDWVERRCSRLDRMTPDDKAAQALAWRVDVDHSNVDWATTSQETWTFARRLTPEQFEFISRKHKQALTVPTPDDIAVVREARAKAEEDARLKREKEEAEKRKAAAAKKRVDDKADWAQHHQAVVAGLEARLAVEAPGLSVETIRKFVNEAAAKVTKKPDINLAKEKVDLGRTLDDEILRSTKQREIAKVEGNYVHLRGTTVKELKAANLADRNKTVADFVAAADQVRLDQLNAVGQDDPVAEWARRLGIKLYNQKSATPFERLAPRAGFHTHYSVDRTGIVAPSTLTRATTAAELLEAVLLVPSRISRIHVSLENGFTVGADQLKLPHRYWAADGDPYDYDLRTFGGQVRWTSPLDETKVKAALDASFDELSDRLLKRARRILDTDGNV